MTRSPRPPSPPPFAVPSCFDPVEEWLVDLDRAAMAGDVGTKSSDLCPEAAALDADLGGVSDGSRSKSCDLGVKEVVGIGKFDGEEVEMGSGGLGEEFGSDQTKDGEALGGSASASGDLVVKEEVSEGVADAEMTRMSPVKELVGGPSRGRGDDEESSEEESEESESSDDDSDDDESSEASSSSEEEEKMGNKKEVGRGGEKDDKMRDAEAFLEESEMVGSDEEAAPKGPIRSKHEMEVLLPVPKIEVQLEPHHQTLPVGTISAIMGERVIVEGSVKHSPLNEGSILWVTESRAPLGIVDEIFGPVKNPYYLVRYNSEKEVPAGINMGTAVSFVREFADHVLNIREISTKGYDASGENDEELTDEPEFSDDEKEAEYKRSLRKAKKQTKDRQHDPQKPSTDKKRTRLKGAGFQREKGPTSPIAPPPGHRQQHHFHRTDMVPAVSDNAMSSVRAPNLSMGAPAQSLQIPMNPAMSSALQLAPQMPSFFNNPSQQFLTQQQNAVWPNGLPPQQQQNMGIEGAYAASILQQLLIGASQYQQQFHNQSSGTFPNRLPVPPQQRFMPGSSMPVPSQQQFMPGGMPVPSFQQQFMHSGGMPANTTTTFGAPSPMPMGQGNFSQFPYGFSNMPGQGFGQLPPPHRDGEQPPMPLNSAQLNLGNSPPVQFNSGNMPGQGFGQLPPPHRDGEQPPMQFNSALGNSPPMQFNSGNMPGQGFGQLPPPHRDGEQPPMQFNSALGNSPPVQFNSGEFNHGNSSFRGRRPHQRGGRHSFGRGGRHRDG